MEERLRFANQLVIRLASLRRSQNKAGAKTRAKQFGHSDKEKVSETKDQAHERLTFCGSLDHEVSVGRKEEDSKGFKICGT